MAVKVFLNYRRDDDAGHAGRLFDHLEDALPEQHVFMDVEGQIAPGDDFQAIIEREVARRDVMLVVIGPRWLSLLQTRERMGPDYVVIEITTALTQGKRVIPVVVGGARLPAEAQLPNELRRLSRLQAVYLRSERFRTDCRSFVDKIARLPSAVPAASAPAPIQRQVEVPEWAVEAGDDGGGRWATFEVNGVQARMRHIPPGRFWMGSPESDEESIDNERPRHEVTLTRGVWLAEVPCTQALWEAVMGDNPSHFKGAERPVEQVNWHDCQQFIEKLNGKVRGLGARLPTEAEWEYACRAGTENSHYGELDAVAWYSDNIRGETQPVAQKQPNAWGLYDMLGNVWEWTSDAERDYRTELVTDPSAGEGPLRVVRGGAWSLYARVVRAACRVEVDPEFRLDSLGFRFARGQSQEHR